MHSDGWIQHLGYPAFNHLGYPAFNHLGACPGFSHFQWFVWNILGGQVPDYISLMQGKLVRISHSVPADPDFLLAFQVVINLVHILQTMRHSVAPVLELLLLVGQDHVCWQLGLLPQEYQKRGQSCGFIYIGRYRYSYRPAPGMVAAWPSPYLSELSTCDSGPAGFCETFPRCLTEGCRQV